MPGAPARAQAPLPGPAEPGQVPRRFEPAPSVRPPERPVERIAPDAAAPPANAAEIRFVLRGVVIEGATVYGPDEFQPLYESMLGREISLLDVYALAERVSAKYRNDGYILSQAVVPPQTIREGIVRIHVVEGYVENIYIEGDIRGRHDLLRDITARIVLSRPLSVRDLEKYVLLIDDLPGVKASAILRPSPTPGASDLHLVLSHKPVGAYAVADNRGSRYVGPIQGNVGFDLNSALGLYERTSLRGIVTGQTREFRFVDVEHEEVVSAEGTRLKFQAARGHSRPGFTLKPSKITSTVTTLGVEATHPVIRSRAENLLLGVRVNLRDIESEQDAGASTLSKDRIRVAAARASYDFTDSFLGIGVNLIAAEISQGFDVLGARESGSGLLSRAAGRSDFTKITAELQRLHGLGDGWSLLFGATGQYALASLLASEEFAFGGARFGRAYDPAELTGDHGVAGKVELRYGVETGAPILSGYQAYGFYDAGVAWNIDAGTAEDPRSGTSLGIGARINFGEHVSANVEIAFPLTAHVAARGDAGDSARIFFSLVGRY
jgi:hemolysin activation/secretion protein